MRRLKLDSIQRLGPAGLIRSSICPGPRVVSVEEGACSWQYGTMQFQIQSTLDPLLAHQRSLRLLRSDIHGSHERNINESDVVRIFDESGRSLSACMHAAVYRPVNVEDYLAQGLNIVSRLPDVSKQTTQFVSEVYARHLAREAFKAIIELGNVYCGEGNSEILSVVAGDINAADHCVDLAIRSHCGRIICVKLTDVCRKVAAEYDAMASTMSMDEASDYLFTRFKGSGRMVSLARLLLRTGSMLVEDKRNLHVVTRGLSTSMRSFSFLWCDAMTEARTLINLAKDLTGNGVRPKDLQGIDFWGRVDQLKQHVPRARISLDAIMAIALAEMGVVVNCHEEGISVLRVIAGDGALMTTDPVSMTNNGSIWLTPFRALTFNRTVLALDGRTHLLMIDEPSGVRHTLGLFERCTWDETKFVCCEPLPYVHIKVVKSTMSKAFAALARDGEAWNDGLEKELKRLSAQKVPSDGVDVDRVVTLARESYLRNNILAAEYVELIFSVKRIILVFTLAVEQGRRMGDVMYQYSLLMVHPDVSRIEGKRLREVWNDTDSGIPEGLRRFVENVRLTYEGWMVYPDTGSAGVKQVRRKFTNTSTVWLGFYE